MTDPAIPPQIRGALIHGPAAHVLAQILHRDHVLEQLTRAGYSKAWRDLAGGAMTAIGLEAQAWRRSALAEVDRQRRGTAELPQSEEVPESQAMTTASAAAVLNVTTRQVRNLAASGKVPATRHAGAWRLDPAAVHARAAA